MTNHHDLENRLERLNLRWLERARHGDFAGAWQLSDAASALRRDMSCVHWPRHQQFIWRGDRLAGRRVLIRCYHGLGDTIQFVRFLPRVRALAKEVALWVQPALIPLLSTLPDGAHRLLPLHDGAPDVEYDVDLELFEVLHALRIQLSDIVSTPCPYLLGGAPRPTPSSERCRVGLVWRAGEWNSSRSIDPDQLAPLRAVSGIEWALFQRGPALAEWPHDFGEAPTMVDMLDEARALQRLDLLISVDTCSAHLAGALGVPVWTLLPHSADWRWMNDRSDTPWYPTMRLIRQRAPGDWAGVIREVRASLEALARRRRQAG